MIIRPSIGSCLALGMILVAGTLAAAPLEAVPQAYRQIAAEFGIPAAVLYAAALTASGRTVRTGRVRPWPWTLTVAGTRYHYPTRAAAHQALSTVLARGKAEVRVGVMGVPWRRYGAVRGGSWAALDPYKNLRIAAARLAPHLAARSAPVARRRSRRFDQLIGRLAPRFALDPQFVREVVAAESAYNPRARSPKGAQGLMQLMPGTAARFGVENPWDPEDNLMGGMRYLEFLLAYYRGDLTRVLAAYNAGEVAVDRHGGVPPYAETRRYVARILKHYGKPTHPYRRVLALKGSRAKAHS